MENLLASNRISLLASLSLLPLLVLVLFRLLSPLPSNPCHDHCHNTRTVDYIISTHVKGLVMYLSNSLDKRTKLFNTQKIHHNANNYYQQRSEQFIPNHPLFHTPSIGPTRTGRISLGLTRVVPGTYRTDHHSGMIFKRLQLSQA
jgi:hypothetical protein